MYIHLLSIPKIIIIACLFLFIPKVMAQKIDVDSVVGSLNFGTFAKTNGGTITIYADGSVDSTGDIFPLSSGIPPSAVRFNISTKGNSSKQVNITSSSTGLSGSAGTGFLELTLTFSDNNFSLPQNKSTPIYMGGTLTVGVEDPPDIYEGTVTITFAFQ